MSSLTMSGAAQSALPEMKIHLDYAQRCAAAGFLPGLDAALDAIAPTKLRVHLAGFTEDDQRAWGEAQDAWARALDVVFETTQTPEEAQIVVVAAATLEMRGRAVGGYTFWKRGVDKSYRGVLTAQMFLAAEANGKPLSHEARRHAAMHELGHIFGLDDSRRLGDVMGPLDPRRPALGLREAEIAVIRQARSNARELLVAMRDQRR